RDRPAEGRRRRDADEPRPPAAWRAVALARDTGWHRGTAAQKRKSAQRQACRGLRALEYRRQAGRGDPDAEKRARERHGHALPHGDARPASFTPPADILIPAMESPDADTAR